MGANVTRKDPKSGEDRTYYKADNGKLYNDYTSARSAAVQRKMKNVMGVDATLNTSNNNPSLIDKFINSTSLKSTGSAYANTYTGNITYQDKQPGDNPYLDAHEAGHLSNEGAGLPKYLGATGRITGAVSDKIGNPGPLELLSGGLTHAFDAREEDRAERLSAKYGSQFGGNPSKAPKIDDQGRSQYGNNLRAQGTQRMAGAAKPLLDSINFIKDKVQGARQGSMEPSIRDAVTNYRSLAQSAGDDITPELLQASNDIDKLREKYNNRGGDFDAFTSSCLLYTSPSPRDGLLSRMPSSA